ncbi:DUF72 domain-containing protein [Nocardia otitidiscaviarum]|uniref:DUF72 domain-containing protein n=1 Tax=Nocardia otitidiscaviarum TaxID=1823 RepID=A0A516NR75_9NOCA|nr:DUF72 domain-containing protein [Nocardia otitidiscaviarum]MCP9625335.1 DUF72 domain-containing protein [Nocardia otitidiscaviarum]QDP81418.1 DUF72 domain-containing protein [Nocardia otitidiscaviarum]
MQLHVGCAMWTHPAWRDYQPTPSRRLHSYATWCNAVEGNTTFYATPARSAVEQWAEQTDPDFRFVLKLPRTVTHERRLRGAEQELHTFLNAVEPLGSRLHALWVQLPGSFGPNDLPTLTRFLRTLPGRTAVEVRHPAFFDDERAADQLERALAGVGAEWIPFDTTVLFDGPASSAAEVEARSKKPRVPRRTEALTDHPIVRYHGRDDVDRTVAGWRPWLEITAEWLREGRSPTVFIHTPDNASSLPLARRFHDEVRARVPELAALPEPEPTEPMTLF